MFDDDGDLSVFNLKVRLPEKNRTTQGKYKENMARNNESRTETKGISLM